MYKTSSTKVFPYTPHQIFFYPFVFWKDSSFSQYLPDKSFTYIPHPDDLESILEPNPELNPLPLVAELDPVPQLRLAEPVPKLLLPVLKDWPWSLLELVPLEVLPDVDVCCWFASIIPQLLCRAAITAGFRLKELKLAKLLLEPLPKPLRLLPNACAPKPFPKRDPRSYCLLPCFGSAFEMWTLTPLMIRSSPQRAWATCEGR